MALTKLSTNLNAHQNLADAPALTPTNLKIAWDAPVNDIKDYINDTLTVEVDAIKTATDAEIATKQDIIGGVSDTEISYLSGVTSAIQTQLDGKEASISYHLLFSGTWASGDSKTITNFSNYKAFIFELASGSKIVPVFKNNADSIISGVGIFYAVGSNVQTISLHGGVSGNTISSTKFYSLLHTGGSTHGTENTIEVTAVYGLF